MNNYFIDTYYESQERELADWVQKDIEALEARIQHLLAEYSLQDGLYCAAEVSGDQEALERASVAMDLAEASIEQLEQEIELLTTGGR
jgi:hypothetical protein